MRLLRALAKRVASPEGHDATVYGTGRASPKPFLRHHLSAISLPPLIEHIVCADALAVHSQAASYAFMLTLGVRRI